MAPLYEQFSFNDQETVVYTGGLGYFLDDGTDTLVSFDNDVVEKAEVESLLEEMRDETFAEGHFELVALVEEVLDNDKISVTQINSGLSIHLNDAITNIAEGATGDPYGYGLISDPIRFIEIVYGNGDGYKNYEYKSLESHCRNYTMAQFSDPYKPLLGNCAPTAITNLITLHANINNISRVKNLYPDEIYNYVAYYGDANKYYSIEYGGAPQGTLDKFIKGSFNECGINVTVISDSNVTYDKVKTEINANRPFYLSINPGYGFVYADDEWWSGHGVAVYAYTRFKNSSNNGVKSFIKIADGWTNQEGRYMDMATLGEGRTIMRKIQ